MKKFEIINEKWIKANNLIRNNRLSSETFSLAIKISSISKIYARSFEISGILIYYITFMIGQNNEMTLEYEKSEESEFKDDLQFFENLLF